MLLNLFIGCTKTESDFEEITQLAITLSASQTNLVAGNAATFTVTSNVGDNLNSVSTFFVNGTAITTNSYTFATAGTYLVKATYQSATSNIIEVTVTNPPTTNQFVSRVLVEEYSGTWCGNCPRILYGTQLLKEQTDKEVSVQIHLFNNDPYITTQGNQLATSLGINGVPTGKINRTINWTGPQYQNVAQVINEIKPSATSGLSIDSNLAGNTINATVEMGFVNTNSNVKLVVYLVEDNLFHTQSNYSSNLYGGLSSIPNFEYDGVLRYIATSLNGDAITVNGTAVTSNFSFAVPSNVVATSQLKLVAFLTDATTGSVLNVRQGVLGTNQSLEFVN